MTPDPAESFWVTAAAVVMIVVTVVWMLTHFWAWTRVW